jgi:hypothetical protein
MPPCCLGSCILDVSWWKPYLGLPVQACLFKHIAAVYCCSCCAVMGTGGWHKMSPKSQFITHG